MITEENNIDKYVVNQHQTIEDAMKMINENKSGTVFARNESGKLIGSLTDGDIRRGFLNGATLASKIEEVMFVDTSFVTEKFSLDEAKMLFREKQIKLLPVIKEDRTIVSVLVNTLLMQRIQKISNYVVLMVGGEGKRLSPLTNEIPKPLLEVGGKPILQIILERLASYGFQNIVLCTRHKAEAIETFCGKGEKYGLLISYFREEEKLGTVGAVKFLEERLTEPFLVMNGDLLTLVNYKSVLDYHIKNKSDLTVCSKELSYTIPYGVLEVDGMEIGAIIEKPSYSYRVSAGIYALDPKLLDFIPTGGYFDITDLMTKVLDTKKRLITFPIGEYWLDIGQHEDYKKANLDFFDHFEE